MILTKICPIRNRVGILIDTVVYFVANMMTLISDEIRNH